jgi:hypothetical protein
MNGTIDATSTRESGVRSVDDGVRLYLYDVAS